MEKLPLISCQELDLQFDQYKRYKNIRTRFQPNKEKYSLKRSFRNTLIRESKLSTTNQTTKSRRSPSTKRKFRIPIIQLKEILNDRKALHKPLISFKTVDEY